MVLPSPAPPSTLTTESGALAVRRTSCAPTACPCLPPLVSKERWFNSHSGYTDFVDAPGQAARLRVNYCQLEGPGGIEGTPAKQRDAGLLSDAINHL